MQQDFSHFLITRFNLRMKSWIAKDEDCEAWMKDRIRIFERFSLPSIAAQTNQNFKWILLFDPTTKDTHADFLERLSQYKFCLPVFLDLEKKGLIQQLRDTIMANMPAGTNHVITTRMDNDDAVHQDFIQEVQNNFTPNQNFVVNFTDGIGYSTNRLSIARRNKINPFASLFEQVNDGKFQTVYIKGHPSLKSVAPVRHIYGKRMYLVNFHENNVLNKHKLTTWVGCIWHYAVRLVCIRYPHLNNKIRYSYAIRQRRSNARLLNGFNIKATQDAG